MARRPQGVRPSHHAGRGVRRDRFGGSQRSVRPAGRGPVDQPARGRADAHPRRPHPADDAVDSRGRRQDPDRNLFPLPQPRLVPASPPPRPKCRRRMSPPIGPHPLPADGENGHQAGRLVRRSAACRPIPRSRFRSVDRDPPTAGRFRGNRDHPSRRGAQASRVSHPPGHAGCGPAGSGRCDAGRRARRIGRSQLSASVIRDGPGVRQPRPTRPLPGPADQP